jgi:hypothetical protein
MTSARSHLKSPSTSGSQSQGRSSDPGDAVHDPAELLVLNALRDHFAEGKHLRFGADSCFWLYTGKFWQPIQEHWIDGRILETHERDPVLTNTCTASLIGQGRALLKAKFADNSDSLSFIGEPAPVINCANGEVWLAADGSPELRPHRPESGLRHCLDLAYDPGANNRSRLSSMNDAHAALAPLVRFKNCMPRIELGANMVGFLGGRTSSIFVALSNTWDLTFIRQIMLCSFLALC